MTTKPTPEILPDISRDTTYLTVVETSLRIGVFSPSAIRTQIFKSAENGLDEANAIRRVAGRVLICWDRYLAWIENPPPPKPTVFKNRRGRKKANRANPYRPGKLVEVESGWPNVD
jgi:hypothetical protein